MNNIQTLSDFYPLMMDQLPGINTPVLDQHLRKACRIFADDTDAFIEELSPINLVAAQRAYTLTPSWDCRIKRIKEVWIRTSTDVTSDLEGTKQSEDLYRFERPDILTLEEGIKPGVAVTDGLVVHVVLVPEVDQTGDNVVSLEFLNDYSEGIMNRALYTLCIMPKQRWSDYDRAKLFLSEYKNEVTRAMGDITLGNKTQPAGFEG